MRQAGIDPDRVEAAHVDETPQVDETPRRLALRLAEAKAQAVAARSPGAFVIGADTVVAVGRRVLPKAETEDQARTCLNLLSGRAHRVLTGVAVCPPSGRPATRLVETRLKFKRLTEAELKAYLATGEWAGKAGGYGVQGRAGAFVLELQGSYTGVVGLPLYETLALLTGLGWPGRAAP